MTLPPETADPMQGIDLWQEISRRAGEGGLNLVGAVSSAAFDSCQPKGRRAAEFLSGCETILVLGSGGPGFWKTMWETIGSTPQAAQRGYHPISDHSARLADGILELLEEQGIEAEAVYPDDSPALNFLQLGEMAGLGTISPVIGYLLHPEFGPWVSLRVAILIRDAVFTSLTEEVVGNSFERCLTCTQSCVSACPVGVYDGKGGVDLELCGGHRHAGHCRAGCAARRACPAGAEHRYGEEEESFRNYYSLLTLRRYLGLGLWRLVPRVLRQSLAGASMRRG